ncbi:hypothetical protein, partial [Streptomyces scabiei]|uniref:hypothetical protein n=1 Tax=Streptomyces scabiei TaxID=1930 RepID=UPI0038F79C18
HKIAKYNTGPKEVKCELFLNFIVFDEHTCTAEATVCWDGPAVAGQPGVEASAAPKTPTPGSTLKKVATPLVPAKPKAAVAAVPDPAQATIET